MGYKSCRGAGLGVLAAVLFAFLTASNIIRAEYTITRPVNLGARVNSPYVEYDASLSLDGLELYFCSNRPGGQGGLDLWVAKRATRDSEWQEAVNVGTTINSQHDECDPGISADGLTLYFASNRSGGQGGFDIWMTTRRTTADGWGEPVNLGSPVNSAYTDSDARLSGDGLTLYFSSNRPGGSGHMDIWMTSRPAKDAPWGAAVNLGTPVNSAAQELNLSISADGRALFFSDDAGTAPRPGGLGGLDMWVASRATTASSWGTPLNLGPSVNSSYDEADPSISTDGSWLFFNSLRPGGLGDSDLWAAQILPFVDFNRDEWVDLRDFARLGQSWRGADTVTDVAPLLMGDGVVDFRDLSALTQYWLQGVAQPIYVTWLGHSSVKIVWMDQVIYVDPYQLTESPHDATLILVTHSHSDHYSPSDIARIKGPGAQFIGPSDVVKSYGSGQVMAPGQTIRINGLTVTGVAMYNLTNAHHLKSSNWVGYVVQIGWRRIYFAGDTEVTPEMKALTDIDVAFLPVDGLYTMTAAAAAEGTKYLKPTLAIPYHWGAIAGTKADADKFVSLAACNAKAMTKGETISSDDWSKDFTIAAYWKLDETTGDIAHDSNGSNHAILLGGPTWQPADGKVGGALELDGVDDYISTPFVLNPSAGSFSVFAWVKGGVPGQVILSQQGGVNWLMAAAEDGALSTELKGSGRTGKPLKSTVVITDGEWHHIGLTWDGSSRVLYVDDAAVAKDTQVGLTSTTVGLNIGADGTLTPDSFWFGLIDDVCISNRAIKP